jgi:hypothetical protein
MHLQGLNRNIYEVLVMETNEHDEDIVQLLIHSDTHERFFHPIKLTAHISYSHIAYQKKGFSPVAFNEHCGREFGHKHEVPPYNYYRWIALHKGQHASNEFTIIDPPKSNVDALQFTQEEV